MKVKVIQLDDRYDYLYTDEERERVGKVFEALKYHDTYDADERYHDMYALNLGNCIWYLPAFCCEVVEEPIIENNTNQTNQARQSNILLVEDGSVDIDKLVEDGFYVIVYRSGATLPRLLN